MSFKRQYLEVIWTNDYDKFQFYEKNREIDYNHCEKKIQESLLLHGWLKAFPMIVDKDYQIRDGQHRFIAARKLGIDIPVVFVDKFDDEDMFGINNASKRWTYKDFLHYHKQKGDKNATILYDLLKEYKLSVRFIFELAHLNFHMVTMSEAKFRDFNRRELENKIALINEIVDKIKIKSERLQCALITLVEHPQYNHKRFLDKLSYQLDRVHRCNTVAAYIEMFQDIYNYRNTNKVIFSKRLQYV